MSLTRRVDELETAARDRALEALSFVLNGEADALFAAASDEVLEEMASMGPEVDDALFAGDDAGVSPAVRELSERYYQVMRTAVAAACPSLRRPNGRLGRLAANCQPAYNATR